MFPPTWTGSLSWRSVLKSLGKWSRFIAHTGKTLAIVYFSDHESIQDWNLQKYITAYNYRTKRVYCSKLPLLKGLTRLYKQMSLQRWSHFSQMRKFVLQTITELSVSDSDRPKTGKSDMFTDPNRDVLPELCVNGTAQVSTLPDSLSANCPPISWAQNSS